MIVHRVRFLKQLFYSGVYLVLFGMLATLVLLFVVRPAAPVINLQGEAPRYEPIVVEQVDVIRHDEVIDLVARLRNPNPRAGVAEYPATFVLKDTLGDELTRQTHVVHLLPGSVQYAVALSVVPVRPVATVEMAAVSDTAFTALPASLTLPSFGTLLLDRKAITSGAKHLEQQTGLVTNNSTFDFQRVEVIVVALDGTGHAIGVGKTFVGELKVGEQRQFVASWPASLTPIAQIAHLATTNIFKEENIIRAIGDPALLR